MMILTHPSSLIRLCGRPPAVRILTYAICLAIVAFPALGSTKTVYERMAHADLVVHVRTMDGTLRLAECQILNVLRGDFQGDKLFIAFRADNMNRSRWKDRIVFEAGHESVLLLHPVPDADDRFRLVGGYRGKINLPKEGAPAYIQAFRRMGEILDMTDIHQMWEAHRGLILETNPYLVEAGFQEILKFRLGNPSMIPVLLGHLESKHDLFRISSLDVLTQVFEKSHRRNEPLGNEDDIVARVLTVAMEDPVPSVRVAAVQALQAYGRADVLSALEQVARDDPSQDVRYQATVSVYHMTNHETDPNALPPRLERD